MSACADFDTQIFSAVLRRPADLRLPSGCPQFTALFQVLPLLKQLLPEVAANHCSAMAVNPIGEVLTSHADHSTFPALQVLFV